MSSRQAEERRSLAPKTTATPEQIERILELKAKGAAASDIKRAIGINAPCVRKIYQIIAEARAMHDPQPKPAAKPRGPRRQKGPARVPRQALDGWWFGKETVLVTPLGLGHVACAPIPVSVSCVPARVVTQTVRSEVSRKTDDKEVHRTFADALADHPLLAGRQNRAPGSPQTQAAPQES